MSKEKRTELLIELTVCLGIPTVIAVLCECLCIYDFLLSQIS